MVVEVTIPSTNIIEIKVKDPHEPNWSTVSGRVPPSRYITLGYINQPHLPESPDWVIIADQQAVNRKGWGIVDTYPTKRACIAELILRHCEERDLV